jgi:hypothetical protein
VVVDCFMVLSWYPRDGQDIRCYCKESDNGRHESLYKSDVLWFEVTSSMGLYDPSVVHASVIILK